MWKNSPLDGGCALGNEVAVGASIDSLNISIQAKASSAKQSLKGLGSELSGLKGKGEAAASGLSAVEKELSGLGGVIPSASDIKDVAAALKQLSSVKKLKINGAELAAIRDACVGVTGGAAISRLASGLTSLSRVKLSKTLGESISGVVSGINGLNNSSLPVEKLRSLAEMIGNLQGMKISSSIGNQLKNIASAANNLNYVKVDKEKFTQLADALSKLANIPKISLTSTVNALEKLPAALDKLKNIDLTAVKDQCQQLNDALGKLPQKMSSIAKGYGAIKAASSRVGSSAGGAFNSAAYGAETLSQKLKYLAYDIRNVTIVAMAMKGIANVLAECINASNEYIEDMNLADTSMGQYAQSAREYAAQVNQVLAIDQGKWLRNQGVFMSMAQGMGVASDKAYTLSQGMTQLGYDLSSFFNISQEDAMQKLQSGLAGEIEPLRRLGYDISEARLQQEAYNMGLSEQVSKMTQAEKACLRYNAILHQITWAQGDMAKTIESPSNMLRVLSDNVKVAARSIGNVFLPMLQAILPIAIAAAKVVATLANMLADLTGGSQIASVEYGNGGLGGLGSAGNDAAEGIGNAGNAAKDTGDKAGSAAGKVKELKRELMGFDEINKFSTQSSNSGSGGSGGPGGGGGGGNGGNGGSGGGIPVQNYDFLGDGKGLGDDLYNAIMDAVKRAAKAFEPLLESVKTLCAAIKHQFEGLDIAGAMENALMGAINLISNAARNVVEILGPMIVAFNFPETIALSFDLAAQMCLTLSSAINGLGSMVKGFTDVALVQLVAWIGDRVRGAIVVCIEVLQSWQNWFQQNTAALNRIGQAAGVGAGLVLRLAEAVADVAFTAAAVAFEQINKMLQTLLTILANSEAARVAAVLLGNALVAIAVSNGISAGLEALGNVFSSMATAIRAKSGEAKEGVDVLSTSLGSNLKFGFDSAKNGASDLASALGLTTPKVEKLAKANDEAKTSIDAAKAEVTRQKAKLDEVQSSLTGNNTKLELYAVKQQQARVKTAEANVALQQSKQRLLEAKTATAEYASSKGVTISKLAEFKVAEMRASAEVSASKAKLAAATLAEGAFTVAKGAATVAQNLLNAAVSAFPGMLAAAALGVLLQALQPVVDTVVNAVKAFLGLDDATGDVTDTTEDANQVLSEEQQQINSNLESIQKYEQSHNNLKDALAMSRMSEEQFAEYLQKTGQTFDEVAQKQDTFVQNTINGFDKIDTSSQISLADLESNLRNNIQVQKNWSSDLQTLMEKTGLDANSALVQGLQSAGPEKVSAALHEVVTDPTGKKLDELVELADEAGSNLDPTLAAAIRAGSGDAQQATSETMDGVASAVADGGQDTSQAASTVDQQTVEQFGSHYNEAKDAGRNLAGGFGDGVREASNDATVPATEVMGAVVAALNGGNGYQQALSAGMNLVGGYGDGISAATFSAVAVAQSAMSQVVAGLNGGAGYGSANSAGQNLMGGYKDGLQAAVAAAVSVANSAMTQVNAALGSGNSTARSKGAQMMQQFVSGLRGGVGNAQSVGRSAAVSVQSGMGSNYNGAYSAGSNEMYGFINGLSAAMGNQAWWKGRDAAVSAQSGLGSNYWGAFDAGRNLMYGFNNGMCDVQYTVYDTARAIAWNAASIMRSALRIHSPSRVTAEIGRFFTLGAAVGMDDEAETVYSSVRDLSSGMVEALDVADEAARVGESIGKGFSDALDGSISQKALSPAVEYGKAVASQARDFSYTNAPSRPSHEMSWETTDDAYMTSKLASAFAQGLVSVQMAQSGSTAGKDTTIVLRVGNEDLARAVVKGQDSLARRGVVKLD